MSIAVLALVSCTVNEPECVEIIDENAPVFYASFENCEGTKTYVDDQLHLYWTADDRLSIFMNTYNQQYAFQGKTGDNSATFKKIASDDFVSGNPLSANYAVYPYDPETSISYEGEISVNLPSVQKYAEKSFGLGANTMVAVTENPDDRYLAFKNLCGYLVVKLYGDETIKSITLEGNNGEKIAGRAAVTASFSSAPSLTLADDATTSITIDCGEGVTLGTTVETATEFWFCIPPVSFSKGFTIIARGAASNFRKSAASSHTIERNIRVSMPALEFEGLAIPEAVDLGLPSGIKWASFNLGAAKPEEYGEYYAWGATEPWYEDGFAQSGTPVWRTGKSGGYNWADAPFNGGSSNFDDGYWNTNKSGCVDGNDILLAINDAAHIQLGDNWRMPTQEECQELIDNCEAVWTAQDGVYGRTFTSKENGNSIFLPAAGYFIGTGRRNAGIYGSYWTSTLLTGSQDNARSLSFNSDDLFVYVSGRSDGRSIRPVCE